MVGPSVTELCRGNAFVAANNQPMQGPVNNRMVDLAAESSEYVISQ